MSWKRLFVGAAAVALLVAAAYVVLQTREGVGDGVVPLVKAEGWRDDLGGHLPPFAILEIAYDRGTAERAWEDNTPPDLPPGDGAPASPGIYAELDEVDLDAQAVIVWSSGESSSCPGWLRDVDTDGAGTVTVERDRDTGGFDACTDDYLPYRMILAVDRDRLPPADELPTEQVDGVPAAGALVTTYPAQP